MVRPTIQSMSRTLERINLSLPNETRQRLRRLAQAANMPEAAFARDLFAEALARAERAHFRKRLEASRTPERRARDLAIAAALERLRG